MSIESPDFNFSSFQDDPQAIEVDVLLRDYADGRRRFNNVDLRECDLSHVRLPLINLEEALLNKANLTGANLAGATLNHVDFSAATLTNANLIAADLVRAKLAGANLAGAVMSGANLSGANFRKTDLTGCSFAGANLSGVDFSGATFKNVNLGGANLKGANLSEVDLHDLDLDSLNLEDTILAESVAERLWSTQPLQGFTRGTEISPVPDDSFYQDFSEPPLTDLAEASFDDYAAAVFPLENPEELAYADTLYASTEGSDAKFTAAEDTVADPLAAVTADDYAPSDPGLTGTLADTDADYHALETALLATDSSTDSLGDYPAGQDWAAAEFPFASPEEEMMGNATVLPTEANPFALDQPASASDLDTLTYEVTPEADQSLGMAAADDDLAQPPAADPLAIFPPLTEDVDLPFEVPPEPGARGFGEPGFEPDYPQTVAVEPTEPDSCHDTEGEETPYFGLAAQDALPLGSESGLAMPIATATESLSPPVAPTHLDEPQTWANSEATAPRPKPARPPGTPLRSPAGQAKSTHSLSDQVVQSIQAALGRRVQYSLQRKLLEVYQQQCAFTGCTIAPLLETVFIVSDNRLILEHPSQGLVLRSDLKTLYELKLIAIHPQKLTVLLAPSLLESDYGYLQSQKIRVPQQKIYHPDTATLTQHLGACKWYSPNYDRDRLATASGQRADVSRPKPLTSPPVLALGLGGIALAGLIGAFAVFQSPLMPRPAAVLVEQPNSVAAQTTDNAINVEAGGIVYNHQGMIVDGNAYLALAQAEQLGLPVADVSAADRIVQGEQPYFKVADLRDLNIPIAWDAETRTVTLDCCETTVETIDLAIGDRATKSPGVIIHNTAYVPVEKLNALNIDLSRVAPQDFLQYEGVAYLKASSLKDLAVQIQWNAATRTLSLNN